MRLVPVLASVLALHAALGAAPAFAQTGSEASDRAAADALFDDARKLMAADRYADACPKLAAAQKLRPGVGTLLNLGDCYEKLGRTASAWATFREAALAAHRAGDERESIAQQRFQALAPALVTMTIVAPAGVDGLEIRRDGVPVDRALWGTAIPIDPGSYAIEAQAPFRSPWSTRVEVKGATVTVNVPALEPESPTDGQPRPLPAAVTATPASPVPPSGGSTQRTLAFALLGAGAAGAVVGTVFGLVSMSAHDDAARQCKLGSNHDQCTQGGFDTNNRAITDGNVSTIAFVVGGAALATGAVLWLTAPSSSSRSSVGVVLGPARLGLGGSW
ncbi:MAG TPA: tetratricopeptide repeat protein [Polyangiaceae bacterium]|jgi:serine/threonine-protein kinase